MTEELKELALTLFCTDLGYTKKTTPAEILDLMTSKLAQAYERLAEAKIVVDGSSAADVDLLVCYAAWLYRGRINQQQQPLQLHRLLRERQAKAVLGGVV